MGGYDEEMFGKSNVRKRKTKREKREEKTNQIEMDMTGNENGEENVEKVSTARRYSRGDEGIAGY